MADNDKDGLCDESEWKIFNTKYNLRDSDYDGIPDGDEDMMMMGFQTSRSIRIS